MNAEQMPLPAVTGQYRWRAYVLCISVYLLAGTVSTLMSGYLPLVVRDLLAQTDKGLLDWIGAFVNAVFLYGWMVGGMLFGYWGDRFGRVRALTGAAALYGLSTLATVWAPDWESVVALRCAAGFGVGGVLVLTTVLVAETWPESRRAMAQGVLAVTFPMGIVLSGLVNYLLPEWRQAFWLGVIPMALAGLLWALGPGAAQKPVSSAAGKKTSVLNKDFRWPLLIGSVAYGAMLVGLWAIFAWTPSWAQSLVAGFSDGQKERGLSMMLLGGGGVLGGVLAGFVIRFLGYRKTLLLVFAACFVLTGLLFGANTGFSGLVYVEMAALAFFFGIGQGALAAWLPELFPVAVRGTATGFCFNIGRIATATAVLFVGPLVAILGGYGPAIFAFSGAFVVGFLAIWLDKNTV